MRLGVIVLLVSVAANLVSVAIVLQHPAAIRELVQTPSQRAAAGARERALRDRLAAERARITGDRAAARRALIWSALASNDLRALINHLRAAGFSPALVRAMVTARINERFAARVKELSRPAEATPFWKPPPKGAAMAMAASNEALRERTQTMRELFADPFFAGSDETRTDLQRWQYGDLSQAKIELIQRINVDYADMTQQVREVMRDIALPEDCEKLALLEREKHADLAAMLTPQELADYELRTSPVTSEIRQTLTLMDATEAEFHAIFELQRKFDEKFPQDSGSDYVQLNEALLQMDDQLKGIIGETRAADFSRARDYGFQELAQIAQRENLPIDDAVRAYDLRARTAAESKRIFDDATLTYDQQLAALRALADNAKAQLTTILGPNAGSAYASSATWVKAIANGSAVVFHGGMTSFPALQPPKPRDP